MLGFFIFVISGNDRSIGMRSGTVNVLANMWVRVSILGQEFANYHVKPL